jgi:integrase/recombinase XerD
MNGLIPVVMPPSAAVMMMPAAPDSSSWEYWLPRWVSRKAVTTRKVYADSIAGFLDYIQWKPIASVTTLDIEAYQQHMVNAGNAAGTVARKVATVCSLVSYIHKRDGILMPRNVGAAVERVKPDNRLADRILSEAEVLRMFDREKHPRNLAMLRVLYSAGVRISELCGLKWKDIVWRDDNALITVLGKGSKTRTVVIYGAAVEALRAIMPADADPEAFVFVTTHGPINRLYCVQLTRQAAERAGIARKVSPHWFRHAAATHSLERGASLPLVSRTLGHSNLATTGRYLHLRPSESMGKFLAV